MNDSIERDVERFTRAISDIVIRDHPEVAFQDETYVRWFSRELREQMTFDERSALDSRAAAFARRVSARILASCVERELPFIRERVVPASVVGTPCQVKEHSARAYCAPVIEMSVAAGAGRALWDEQCDTWVALPPDLPKGDYFALTVAGDSMLPVIGPRDRILVKAGTSADVGSVVVANRDDDGCVVKYLSAIHTDTLELVSLNPAHDPLVVRRTPHAIVGTVIARLRSE